MSDAESNFEAQSDSFWEIGQFKRTVKRTDDGYKLCNDLMQMLDERASIEKLYAKSLKGWSKKWNEYLEKSSEYGTMKASWNGMTTEAANLSDIHLQMHTDIEELLITEIKAWQKQNYPKTMMNTIKISKQYEEEFQKAQKPWSKKYMNVEKCKKEYHSQCKSLQTARLQEINAKSDPAISQEQRKKIEDKVEKLKKESESAKHKYQQTLEELNESNSRYIEDMKIVYKKCDLFEKQRLEFFISKFLQAHSYLDLTKKEPINTIYTSFLNTIKGSNPDKDLLYWSKTHGAQMNMAWPTFEEYSEELRNISKSAKPQKLMDDNGVTMVSIKQKEDQVPDAGASAGSGLRRRLSSLLRKKKKSKDKTVKRSSTNLSNYSVSAIANNVIISENKSSINDDNNKIANNKINNDFKSVNNNNNNNNDNHKQLSSSSSTSTSPNKSSCKLQAPVKPSSSPLVVNSNNNNNTTTTKRNNSLQNSRSSIQQVPVSVAASSTAATVTPPSLPQRADSYPDTNNPFNDDDFSDEDSINNNNNNSNNSKTNSIKKPTISPPPPPPPVPQSKSSSSIRESTNRHENEYENINTNNISNALYDDNDNNNIYQNIDHHLNDNNNNKKIKNYAVKRVADKKTKNATADASNPFDSDDDNTNHNSSHENGRFNANHSHSHSLSNNGVELNVKVKALYDYQSTEDDELTLKAGEVFIKLSNEDDRGWCRGKIGNKVGLYPATYAEDAS